MEIAADDWVCQSCGRRDSEMLAVGTARAYRCRPCGAVSVQQVGSIALASLPDEQTVIADLLELRRDLA